ncbi:MAG TPA: hypothetical protein VHG90_10170, partial [Acidimicrobiales bacterium]|nr:hypothetical protein [Acidimicrobiales bacterium]
MSMTPHPSFEDLSAYHDGEAPEWAPHVSACPECRARVDQLAALTAAVARPLEEATAAEAAVGDAVAGALAAVDDEDPAAAAATAGAAPPTLNRRVAPPAPGHPGRTRWLKWVTAASAAAVLLLVVDRGQGTRHRVAYRRLGPHRH